MKDNAKRCVDIKQWDNVQVIYRHESWDKIWLLLKIDHPAIAAKIANKKSPKVHPVVFLNACPLVNA